MKFSILIITLLFVSSSIFANFSLTIKSIDTVASASQEQIEINPANVTSLNAFPVKSLQVIEQITFPNRKDHEEVARVYDGKEYYWMVAFAISGGEYVDVKDQVFDPEKPSCTFSFNLSSHAKYKVPYVLEKNETLFFTHITKSSSSMNNLYFFNFKRPDNRFSLWCRTAPDQEMTVEDFNAIIDGIFKLQVR